MFKDLALKLKRITRLMPPTKAVTGLHFDEYDNWVDGEEEEEPKLKHFDEEIFGDYFKDKKSPSKKELMKEDKKEQERYEQYWKDKEKQEWGPKWKDDDFIKKWELRMLEVFKTSLKWVEPNKLAFGPAPDDLDLEWLEEQGFHVLVSFLEDFNPKHYQDYGFKLYHFPIVDFTGPNIKELDSILDTIESLVAGGNKVYIHCFSGQGRSGTVIAAYYIRKGLDYKAAIAKVRTLQPMAVENFIQVEALKDYEKYIKVKQGSISWKEFWEEQ